jgi:hypothetical protein
MDMNFITSPPAGQPGRFTFLRHEPNYCVGPGETAVIGELTGSGYISHIWVTTGRSGLMPDMNRKIVLRFYWDGEEEPSVECPLGDFFGILHGIDYYPVANRYIKVNPDKGMNTYFPMPFSGGCRLTVTNEGEHPVPKLFIQADYILCGAGTLPSFRFHAVWRRENPCQRVSRKYTVLDAQGKGILMGAFIGIKVLDDFDGWFHGGGDTVYLDGEGESSLIHGIGGEDFFGAAWGIAPFDSEFSGCTCKEDGLLAMYRFYRVPLKFEHSIRFDFGAMANDLCSTVYWYQEEPHRHNTRLISASERTLEAEVPRESADDPDYLPVEQEWFVAGPFDNRSRNFDETFTPERTLDASLDEESGPIHNYWRKDYPSIPIKWQEAEAFHGFIDFTNFYRPKTMKGSILIPGDVIGYAWGEFDAGSAGDAVLRLSHDDPVQVWINGRSVIRREGQAGLVNCRVQVPVQPGKNTVLVKCGNRENYNWWWWGFKAFFTTLEGKVLPVTVPAGEKNV